LQRLKPVRPLRAIDLQNEVEIDEMIGKLTDTMREAAMNDRKLNKEGNPAIAKLKLLPQVLIELSKTHWHNQLLEANVLECVRFWLDPLDDGSLPSLDIQQSMLSSVEKVIHVYSYFGFIDAN
jgi:transcription factor SPN1